jgi:hypothetical protein
MLPVAVAASPWRFAEPYDVSTANGPGIFHHLGSSGRFGVSTSGELAGIAWEDNRDGLPRCYVAIVAPDRRTAASENRISGKDAAFEPVIQGLDSGRFAVAWEENGGVWLRIVDGSKSSPAVRLDESSGAQAALSWRAGHGLVAVWSQKDKGVFRIWIAHLDVPAGVQAAPVINNRMVVEAGQPGGDQTYPSVITLSNGELVVAWEDRRRGHTVILATHQVGPHTFSAPVQINESFWGGRKLGMGRGTGAMRVSLATASNGRIIGVWADKRDFRSGYDIYAAVSPDGAQTFGDNQKVQDEFADGVAQWHPSVGAGGRDLVVVWDDDRDGSPDIWLSFLGADGWSADLDVPGASGEGVQVEPALTIDRHGGLHLAWVEKAKPDGPSRVRYLFAPLER